MKKLMIVLIGIFLISLSSSQILNIGSNNSNNNIINIKPPQAVGSSGGGGAGSNVTSVSSGDGCIFVSSTGSGGTGDITITFNTSCGSSNPLVNIFDQWLNTTDRVVFDAVNITKNLTVFGRVSFFGINYTGATGSASLVGSTSPTISTPVINQLRGGTGINNNITIVPTSAVVNNSHIVFRGNFTNTSPIWATINATEYKFYIPIKSNDTVTATYFIGDGSMLTNLTIVVPGNSTLLHCSNITGNGLCPTDSPRFNNGTFNNLTLNNQLILDGQYDCVVMQEVSGEILDFGCNFNQSGLRNNSKQGGFIRLDMRTVFTDNSTFFTIFRNAEGTTGGFANEIELLRMSNRGDLYTHGNISANTTIQAPNFLGGNISVKNASFAEWIFGKNLLLSLAGTAIFPDTTFNVRAIDVGAGLVSIPAISFTGGAGLTVGAILDGLYVIPQVVTTSSRILLAREPTAQDVWVFENNNNTGALQIFRQNPFGAGNLDGIINITGYNITSNHQTYNISMALDTTYTNTYQRPISLKATFESSVSGTGDVAYATLYSNGTRHYQQEGVSLFSGADQGDATRQLHALEIDVQPNERYSLNSTVSGNGALTMVRAELIVI